MTKSTQQTITDLNRQVTELENVFRIGTVQSVNKSDFTARVAWSNGMRSAWLKIPQRYGAELIITEDGAHSDGDGGTISDHDHPDSILGYWYPEVGDTVFSYHRYGGDGDGIIIGTLEN